MAIQVVPVLVVIIDVEGVGGQVRHSGVDVGLRATGNKDAKRIAFESAELIEEV